MKKNAQIFLFIVGVVTYSRLRQALQAFGSD